MTAIYSMYHYRENKLNGFSRQVKPNAAQLIRTVDLKFRNFYISGATTSQVFLSNYSAPGYLTILNTTRWNTAQRKINRLSNAAINWEQIRTIIDSPIIYMTEGITPVLLKGNVEACTVDATAMESQRFVEAKVLNEYALVVKKFDLTDSPGCNF